MTREEALNKAINIVRYFEAHFAKSKEAREDMANIIEALEQEPFINKPCVSSGVCEHDKNKVLDKIRAEIENHCGLLKENHCRYCSYCNCVMGVREIIEIIDKYKAESEQEPCEDAVSRQAVIELCEGWWLGHTKEDDFATEVRALPSVNPQKIGHWKEHRNRATGHIETVCSECGAEEGYPYNDYCGNCGAKMIEPQESEDKE